MLVINNESGARIFTTATIFIDGEKFTTLRSLGEVSKAELNNYMLSVFTDECFTDHLKESELVLGNRYINLGDGVSIEIDVDWITGGLVNCNLMAEWESAIKKARKTAKMLAE